MLGAMAPGGGIGIGIALDATQIYWPNWRAAAAPPPCGGGCVPPGDTALVGVRVAGGSPTLASPWTPGTPGIRSVALDATYAYFTDGISILRATRK